MPQYKLIYFNIRGRAELIRLLFAQAGVEYEDYRIDGNWATLKPTMPTGTVPVLEIDGKKLAQSQAIVHYLAREFKLAGDSNLEIAQAEQVQEAFVDITTDLIPIIIEKDETKKAELRKSIYEEKIKTKLKYVDNMLAANGGEFFVGNKLTVADLAHFVQVERMCVFLGEEALKDYPKLVSHKERLGKEPRIAAWVAKRPQTSK